MCHCAVSDNGPPNQTTRVAKLAVSPSVTSNLRQGFRVFPSLYCSRREAQRKACWVAIIPLDNIDDT